VLAVGIGFGSGQVVRRSRVAVVGGRAVGIFDCGEVAVGADRQGDLAVRGVGDRTYISGCVVRQGGRQPDGVRDRGQCSGVLVFLEGDREAQAIVEEDRPRKERKDTETECRPDPTRLDVTPCRTALPTRRIPSVFSVLSVVKSSSFLSGCGFANGKSTGRSFCGFAAWRELPRSFLHETHQTHEKKAKAGES
jgi:hypothetical protein